MSERVQRGAEPNMPSFDTRISLVVFFALNSCGKGGVDMEFNTNGFLTDGNNISDAQATLAYGENGKFGCHIN